MKRLLTAAILAAMAMPAHAAPWCMTRGGIPHVDRPASRAVLHVPFKSRSGAEVLRLCPAVMHCILVMTAPLSHITARAGNQRAIGYTDRQCGPTPRGRACIAVVVVAPAGSVDYAGRTVDRECVQDTLAHELAHAYAPDGWTHRH